MTEREKIIEALKRSANEWHKEEFDPMARAHFSYIEYNKLADVLIAANIGDVTAYKAEAEYWEKICKFEGDEYHTTIKNAAEHARHLMQERDEWKERAERMHKEALKQKQRVSDSKHSEDTMRNQIECAMSMVSEMEHAKRALEILYMSGVITEEALGDAVKQAKLEIEEENDDDR